MHIQHLACQKVGGDIPFAAAQHEIGLGDAGQTHAFQQIMADDFGAPLPALGDLPEANREQLFAARQWREPGGLPTGRQQANNLLMAFEIGTFEDECFQNDLVNLANSMLSLAELELARN
jgi:hypothetical protein